MYTHTSGDRNLRRADHVHTWTTCNKGALRGRLAVSGLIVLYCIGHACMHVLPAGLGLCVEQSAQTWTANCKQGALMERTTVSVDRIVLYHYGIVCKLQRGIRQV
jgi:hypothetical protein